MSRCADLLGGRFTVGDLIGRGAAGSVYHGIDTTTGHAVAIKLLEGSPEVARQLLDAEAMSLHGLSHPCIVRMLGSGVHEGRPYLVIDYVAGGSLESLLARERLSVVRVVEIGIDLADALQHAHDHGAIHRDVKPSNVLLALDGTPRLTDFGIAAPAHAPAAGSGGLVGTLAYLSPEGFRGEAVGPESDVWSLGLVLYQMLAGALPFGSPTTEGELTGLAERPVPLVSEFRPEVPDALVSLLASMLDRDRTARIGTAGAVARALEEIHAGLSGQDEPASAAAVAVDLGRGVETPFVGRAHEQKNLLSLLKERDHRLVSLVGPGGIGKTRLATETAALACDAFPDGVKIVALAPVPSPALMVGAIATAIGLTFRGAADPNDQLLEFLRTRHLLLILDNMEHLLEGMGLLESLIAGAHRLTVLATSRERLGHPAETVVELHGLAVPSVPEAPDPSRWASLQVFLHAAIRASPRFVAEPADWSAIAAICRLVEGNPLGIQLAASSAGRFTCEEIARRLTTDMDVLTAAAPDLPPRHRSMRAVFDHSWHLLRESEQGVFRRMALFRGGFTLEAARAVAGASMAAVSSLAGKSLLVPDSSHRYSMHEVVRQYAQEALARVPGERQEAEELHAEFYGRFVVERESALGAAKESSVFSEIERELPNIRAGWDHVLSTARCGLLTPYLRGLHRFFEHRSRFQEGDVAFKGAAAILRTAASTDESCREALATALTCWSALIYRRARYQEARDVANEARAMAGALDMRVDAASAANTMGIASIALGDVEEARVRITEALATWDETGNLQGQGACHANLGLIADGLGQFDEANEHYRQALAIFSRIDHKPGKATVLQNLTGLALHRGDFDETRGLADEALLLARSVGDRLSESRALATLGIVDQRLGDHEGAISRFEKSIAIKRQLGDRRGLANTLAHLGVSLAAKGLHDCADAILEEAYDEAEAIGDRHHQGMAMMFRGDHAMQLDRSAKAERWYREAMVHALATGALPQVSEITRGVARLKNRFGNMAGALEAFLVGRAQPYYQEGWPELDAAIADLQGALAPDTVEEVRAAAAAETLEDFARKLLAEPHWT